MNTDPQTYRQKRLLSAQLCDAIKESDIDGIEQLLQRGADPSVPMFDVESPNSRIAFTPAGFAIKWNEPTLLPYVIGAGMRQIPCGMVVDGVPKNLIEMLPYLRNPPAGMLQSTVNWILSRMAPDVPETNLSLWRAAKGFLQPVNGAPPQDGQALFSVILMRRGATPPNPEVDISELLALPVAQSTIQSRPPKPFVRCIIEMGSEIFTGLFAAGYCPNSRIAGVPLIHFATIPKTSPIMEMFVMAGARPDVTCEKSELLAAGFPEKECAALGERVSPLDLANAFNAPETASLLQSALAKSAIDRVIAAARSPGPDA